MRPTHRSITPLVLLALSLLAPVPHLDAVHDGASGPRIVLFERPHFRGGAIELTAGAQISDLREARFSDGRRAENAVSSILIEPGASLVVHTDARFAGAVLRLSQSVENLADHSCATGGTWNDVISSVRTALSRFGGGNEPRAIFYKAADFSGSAIEVFPGESFDDLSKRTFDDGTPVNDEISSVELVGPVRVRVASASRLREDLVEFTSEVRNLRDLPRGNGRTWNDCISSIVVERISVVDRPPPSRPGHTPAPRDPDVLITGLFNEVLLRAPSAAELASYRRRVQRDGWSEGQIRGDLQRSVEHRDRVARVMITRAYVELLGRDPDAAGLDHYAKLVVERNWSEKKLRETLRASDEYRARQQPAAPRPVNPAPSDGSPTPTPTPRVVAPEEKTTRTIPWRPDRERVEP